MVEILKVSKFQNEFMMPSFLPQYEPNIVMISALYCAGYHTTGQKSLQFLVHILGETMTSEIHSEIHWPLTDSSNFCHNGRLAYILVQKFSTLVLFVLRSTQKTIWSTFFILNLYPPKSCFRILILYLQSKFSFPAHIFIFLCNDLQF